MGLQTLLRSGWPAVRFSVVQICCVSSEGDVRLIRWLRGWLSSLPASAVLQVSKSRAACRAAALWLHCCCGTAVVLGNPSSPDRDAALLGEKFRHRSRQKDKNPLALYSRVKNLIGWRTSKRLRLIKSLKRWDLLSITWLHEFVLWICSRVLCQVPQRKR